MKSPAKQPPKQLDLFALGANDDKPLGKPLPKAQPRPSQLSFLPPMPKDNGQRRIQLDTETIEYTLIRSKRRTIGFLVNDEGLRISAPKWITLPDIERAITDKKRWILTKLNEQRERASKRIQPEMQWCDGAPLPYLGTTLTLRLRPELNGVTYDVTTQELFIGLPSNVNAQQLKDRVQGWLQDQAMQLFGERLAFYATKLGVSYAAYGLSSATTQWGSCTSNGKIRLNWRLMHFSLAIIDYVVAHELSHLREMNHSPRFWETVQSIFPEFKTAKEMLRHQGPETLPTF